MKFNNIYFLKSCFKSKNFPNYTYPEFAFLGRSNVGKSSLINMILHRKNLVKTGAKPGVTQAINFFVIDDKKSIVDLPGFGYAKAPKKVRESFMPMIKEYIEIRVNLKVAFLLIDIRRVPDDFELNMMEHLTNNKIPFAITLTKCDKLSKNQRVKNKNKIIKVLGIDEDSLFFSSSKSGEGKKEILKLISEYSQQ
jgi:GTP-binding protein